MTWKDEDVVTRDPPNVESAWDALRSPVTPTDGFYTRNNHPVPRIAPEEWSLDLRGFGRHRALAFDELVARPAVTLDVVLECAGNGRTYFDPLPEGTAWRERAVGCASFTGARLADLLAELGVPDETREVVFRGADHGQHAFERALPLEVARDPDVLLAWAMNGEPLRPLHGAPVRLVVPRWYGIASVKWLVEMRPVQEPLAGHFQTERYVYERPGKPTLPVREKRVNSLVVEPAPGARLAASFTVRGWAWSGAAPIARVEVSVDGGRSWRDAELEHEAGPHAWRGWSLRASAPPDEAVVLSRAHDAAGNAQPDRVEWNAHGYGYNAPRPRRVPVAPRAPA